MATVRMRKGNVYADIYDSAETIANASAEGYVLVREEPKETKVVVEEPAEEKPAVHKKARR